MSDLGEITPCWTITFRRQTKHPPERVWAAITEAEQVSRWWHLPARIDLRIGGEYHVDFGGGKGIDGIIFRLQLGQLLAYVWNRSVIEWTIEPEGTGSRYTFVDHGTAAAPDGADYTNEGVAAGYHQGLDGLEALLDGKPLAPEAAVWEALQVRYRPLLDRVLRTG